MRPIVSFTGSNRAFKAWLAEWRVAAALLGLGSDDNGSSGCLIILAGLTLFWLLVGMSIYIAVH